MARPRKPTRQKKLEGTLRPDRTNTAEPEYEAAIPNAPDWLGPVAREAWQQAVEQLHPQRVLSRADWAVLASWAVMFAEVAEFTEMLDNGRKFLIEEDGRCKYPLSQLRRESVARLQSLSSELGMSPASRSKVSSIAGKGADDPMAAPPRQPRKPARKDSEARVN